MKNKCIVLIVISYLLAASCSIYGYASLLSSPIADDRGHLLPVKVKSIESATGESQLVDIVNKASRNGDKLTIAGMQHSQGGHTYYPNGIMIDMKKYNKILAFDPAGKKITVQSGATWDDIQRYINPYGLAVKVMQSQNIFTIGGSMSVNVHGRDIRNDALIDTIHSFRLLDANGEILNVSRTENKDLFPLVIGGYGLFGIILDVSLYLTENELYRIRSSSLNYKDYSAYFKKHVKGDAEVKMHLARISVAPETFLTDMYTSDYILADDESLMDDHLVLKEDSAIAVPKFFMGLARYSDWGKDLFWKSQQMYMKQLEGSYETRNNVMRSNTAFMEYENSGKTEVLQEFFIPVDRFSDYIDGLRDILEADPQFNILNITVRYVETNDHAFMSYAKDDMFSLVLLINQKRTMEDTEKTKETIRKMIKVTLQNKGSYYLPYYPYASKTQLNQAYPRAEEFFKLKRKYDPEERFVNLFYKEYGR
ncbi:FAD-dependent oxidoreductase [Peribacillus sp. SCS-155]|uniref:FAD-binding oxidoreductase n=1 Tax=Peribacillus sedimenti TaxID=3115297 RepID=UPI003906C167